MLSILSPAKNMAAVSAAVPVGEPVFRQEADRLAVLLKSYAPWQLESLLRISPVLAMRAYDAIQAYEPMQAGFPALLSYRGLAYTYLAPETLKPEELLYAQEHLRLLSAQYGLLRPLDGIQPYRLEMGSRLRVDGGDLYAFWGERPCRELFAAGGPVVNLASAEYARMIQRYRLPGEELITCEFRTWRQGRLSMPATDAKMARGRMARYLIQNRIDRPEGLWEFNWDDYAFEPGLSTAEVYVFVRG